jgi:hypothetical protein
VLSLDVSARGAEEVVQGLDGNLDQDLNGAIHPQMESFITSQRRAGGPSLHLMSPAGGTPLPPKGAGKVPEQNAHRRASNAPHSAA